MYLEIRSANEGAFRHQFLLMSTYLRSREMFLKIRKKIAKLGVLAIFFVEKSASFFCRAERNAVGLGMTLMFIVLPVLPSWGQLRIQVH